MNRELRLRSILDKACEKFLKLHRYLLTERISERAMCHKFAELIQPEFLPLHVDCEYNRNCGVKKTLPSIIHDEDRGVFPDIIVHERGTDNNVLVIEAKCSDSNPEDIEQDELKLESYTKHLNYAFSCLLTFEVGENIGIKYKLK